MAQVTFQKPAVTVICTILQEKETVLSLLQHLDNQRYLPKKVIIADGGSTQPIWQYLTALEKKKWNFELQIVQKKGNRSVGRNHALAMTKTDLVAITDAGCLPEMNWLQALVEKQLQSQAPVIAGYYQGLAESGFQEAMIPYALVMPDKVDPENFLPATRSMLLQKQVWEQLGGFNEALSDNEDYAFARHLLKEQVPIVFAQEAIVQWQPRTSLPSFAKMIFRFARGDAFSGIIRPKVVFLFGRYATIILLVFTLGTMGYTNQVFWIAQGGLVLYLTWTIVKNYRYCPNSWYWLPVLQLVADAMVISGSLIGWWNRYAAKR
ncbi:MAG: glycosyltransferase [Patescibacteria group bacterium]